MTPSPANSGDPLPAGVTSRSRAFAERLIRYATDWVDDRLFVDAHRRYIEELDRSGELGGLLEAVGLTRKQLQALEISPLASAELLAGMLEHLGIAGIDVRADPESSTTLELRCRACGTWRECRHWLEGGAQGDGYREFCPNAALLDRLRRGSGKPSP
jgi:hypothetical protein